MFPFQKVSETAVGLPAGTVKKLIEELTRRRVNLHSLMLLQGNKVFCEEYAPEFDENSRHRLYSSSKTYAAMAIGVAIGEGLLALDSKVADFFSDKLPENPHPYLLNLTVKDCLMMATPFNETPYNHLHEDWLADFFQAECTHRGGSIFHYDTGATLVLCALVQRVTGMHFNEYLYNRVLRHIGYTEVPPCVESPEGTKWGGSGLLCTTREFAAFARLLMQGGRDESGVSRIPQRFVEEATAKQIGNAEGNGQNFFRGYGYGYQIWHTKIGFALFGMGNQLALCVPAQDILLVCTGDDQGNDFARNYIIEYLESMIVSPLGGNYLSEQTGALHMPLPMGEAVSALQGLFSGKAYTLAPNPMGMERVRFVFDGAQSRMEFYARGEEKVIPFGLGCYAQGIFPEKDYSGMRINTPLERGYRCFAAAAWDLPDLLVLKCYAADMYFGVFTLNVRFSETAIDLHFEKKAEWFFEEYSGYATGVAE